jgi:uncharacterized protein
VGLGPWYIVIGYDRPDFPDLEESADRKLNEAHWSYIDLAQDLLARGPMLTGEHDGHTGSVHVIAANDIAAAREFAFNEPYYLAGLYATVDVYAFDSWLTESMWDRHASNTSTSWFTQLRFGDPQSPVGTVSGELPDSVLCAGWMATSDPSSVIGAALLIDGTEREVTSSVSDLGSRLKPQPDRISVTPWRRGGRN